MPGGGTSMPRPSIAAPARPAMPSGAASAANSCAWPHARSWKPSRPGRTSAARSMPISASAWIPGPAGCMNTTCASWATTACAWVTAWWCVSIPSWPRSSASSAARRTGRNWSSRSRPWPGMPPVSTSRPRSLVRTTGARPGPSSSRRWMTCWPQPTARTAPKRHAATSSGTGRLLPTSTPWPTCAKPRCSSAGRARLWPWQRRRLRRCP